MSVFTLEMKLLTAIVLEEYATGVKKELLRLGVLDFVEVGKLTKDQHLKLREGSEHADERALDLLHQIESLYRQIHTPLPQLTQEDVQEGEALDIPSSISFLSSINRSLLNLRENQKRNNQESLRYQEMMRYIKEKKLEYLDFHVGVLDKAKVETLSNRLNNNASVLIPIEEKDTYLLCTFARDRSAIESHLEVISFKEEVSLLSINKMIELTHHTLNTIIEEKNNENTHIINSISETIKEKRGELEILYKEVRLYLLLGEITSHFSHTRNTTIFSGWVPSNTSELVEKQIQKVTKGKCVIEFGSSEVMNRREVPVAIENSPILAPFQKIVNNYSTLEYGSINPTIFVTISYLAMFGLMFADAGQGAVLLLLGLYGLYKEKRGMKEGSLLTFSLLRLMMYLGASSIVFGAIFGSYFGLPLLPPIWFDYHSAVFSHGGGSTRDVYSILGITIYFGIIIIYLGLIINWINLLKKKEYLAFIFSKNGIIGAFLFSIGIYIGRAFVLSNYQTFPNNPIIMYGIAFAVLLLFFRVPVEHYVAKREGKEVHHGNILLDSFMEWIVILLEIFSGYLANTLSFMRVAGLGIAHVALMSAFSDIADLTGSVIGKILIFVAGNALVIALEGLSAGIQSLRLNYYEFFTKFFVGDGKQYNPLSLQSKTGE
ncbi:MAG: ATPase [Spirochaetia bacterium]|nr:ATPase [Spirochaetia bacterium]